MNKPMKISDTEETIRGFINLFHQSLMERNILTDRSDVPKGYLSCECGFSAIKGSRIKGAKRSLIICSYCFHVNKKGARIKKPCKCEILRRRLGKK
jgi:hypothetical protein